MRILIALIFVLCCSILSNCATIIHGTRQDIAFSSYPTGAEVSINGINRGRTPVTINLERNMNYSIKVQLEEYIPYEIYIVRQVDAWIAGNIIFGGIIGLAVDAISGAMYKLSPEQVHAELRKNDEAFIQNGDYIYIAVVMEVDPLWEKIGNLQKTTN